MSSSAFRKGRLSSLPIIFAKAIYFDMCELGSKTFSLILPTEKMMQREYLETRY